MAVTLHRYNHTIKLFTNGDVDKSNIKGMLLNSSRVAAFDATHTTVDEAAGAASGGHRADEVYGNNWTEGGEVAGSATVAIRSTSGAALTVADVRVTASAAGPIGPAYGVLWYDATNNYPLYLDDFGQAETAGEETDFLLVFDPAGTRGTVWTVT